MTKTKSRRTLPDSVRRQQISLPPPPLELLGPIGPELFLIVP